MFRLTRYPLLLDGRGGYGGTPRTDGIFCNGCPNVPISQRAGDERMRVRDYPPARAVRRQT